ncbi:MAG TPA: serine hydrolase domain-containing protein [Tepidisphaeraceae bacterium]|jgi:CubicO group peptidase (beta-lactamase class C family)
MTPFMLRLIGIAGVLLAPLSHAQPPQSDPAKLAAIPERLKPFIDKHEITGAVTCVADRDHVIHLAAIGQANVAADVPMKTDSMFWIASMTKPITSTAILMLQDEGKLNVDDPVAKYIPEFANVKTPSGKPANLTLKHLLTHTSGLAENTPEQSRSAKTLADLIPGFVNKPTQFEPGTQWRYCQTGINTLGRIIEVVGGEPYPQFLQKRIFDPLGMKDTTFYPSKEQQARVAHSYRRNNQTGSLDDVGLAIWGNRDLSQTDRYPMANGGLFSTAADYAQFCRMLLNNGTLDGHTYLKAETVKLMTTIHTGDLKAGFVPGSGWGLAVGIVREPVGLTAMLSPGTFGHGGAYGTQAWIDPVKGVAYILMVQRANFPNSDASDVRKTFQQAAAEALK